VFDRNFVYWDLKKPKHSINFIYHFTQLILQNLWRRPFIISYFNRINFLELQENHLTIHCNFLSRRLRYYFIHYNFLQIFNFYD
jgi:hypothetical protein